MHSCLARAVVERMREKEANGDPDMLELKQFLMTEVVTSNIIKLAITLDV